MMKAIQIGRDMLIMRYEERDGKVHNLQMRCLPIGVYLKLYHPQTLNSKL